MTHHIGVFVALTSCKCIYLVSCDKCGWFYIPILDGLNLSFHKYYPSPHTKPEIINYFQFLKNEFDTQIFWVIVVGNFSTPSFDCNY
jgi:hypothetical protein